MQLNYVISTFFFLKRKTFLEHKQVQLILYNELISQYFVTAERA